MQKERAINITELHCKIAHLRPVVQNAVMVGPEPLREARSRVSFPTFSDGDFVLVARDEFTACERLSLCCCDRRLVIKPFYDYVYQVENLPHGLVKNVHISRLKFYHNPSLDKEAIMSHVILSKIGLPVQRLMRLVETDDGLMVQVCWRGLAEPEYTLEPLGKVHDDVPQPFEKLLKRKNNPALLASKARPALALEEGECND